MERLTVDIPEEYLGSVTQLLASRKGTLQSMANHGSGWVRLEFLVPARGLIGLRTRFLTDTHGTGVMSSIGEGFAPWQGEITARPSGSLVADRAGTATPYAMAQLQERASLLVPPGSEVYMGQVVGENSRGEDMDVNVTREKKQTNMRSASADVLETLTPPRKLSLEEALEFASEDEFVEVTPRSIRVRKIELDPKERAKAASRKKRERLGS